MTFNIDDVTMFHLNELTLFDQQVVLDPVPAEEFSPGGLIYIPETARHKTYVGHVVLMSTQDEELNAALKLGDKVIYIRNKESLLITLDGEYDMVSLNHIAVVLED